jgi:hypothetical protein
MSQFKRFPNSLRYFAARLRAWSRPTILVPIVIFCIGGLLLWEVAVNPELISNDEEEEVTDSNLTSQEGAISSEDSAIAAEIDTVPFLTNQLYHSSVAAGLINGAVLSNRGLFDEVQNRRVEPDLIPAAPKPSSINTHQAFSNSETPIVPVSPNFNSGGSLTNSILSGATLGNSTYAISPTSPFTANSPNTEKSLGPPHLELSTLQMSMEKGNKRAGEQKRNETSEISLCSAPSALCSLSSIPDSTATNSGNYPFPANEAQVLSTNQPQFSISPATTSDALPGQNPRVANTVLTSPSNNQLNNPNQTNLSGAELVPEIQPVAPRSTISTIPGIGSAVPNYSGQSAFASPIQTSKIINSVVPNSQNVGFPTVSPAGSNLGVPAYSQINQNLPPTGQVTTAVPEPLPIPGRYIGEGKIKTFANP